MKLMFICAAIVLLASACNPATPTPSTNAPGSSANASPTATPANASQQPQPQSASNISDEQMIAREKELWDALKRRNYKEYATFLADDLIEIIPSGMYDKAGSVRQAEGNNFSGATLSDFKVVKLNNDSAIVAYLVNGPVPVFSISGERHSTVWANRNGKWLAVFHQSTLVSGTPQVTPQSPGSGKSAPLGKQRVPLGPSN